MYLRLVNRHQQKPNFRFFSVFFRRFSFFRFFFQYRRRCRFRFFKISRYRFRFSVTDSALLWIRWRDGSFHVWNPTFTCLKHFRWDWIITIDITRQLTAVWIIRYGTLKKQRVKRVLDECENLIHGKNGCNCWRHNSNWQLQHSKILNAFQLLQFLHST